MRGEIEAAKGMLKMAEVVVSMRHVEMMKGMRRVCCRLMEV